MLKYLKRRSNSLKGIEVKMKRLSHDKYKVLNDWKDDFFKHTSGVYIFCSQLYSNVIKCKKLKQIF